MLIKKLNVVLEIDPSDLPSYKVRGFKEYIPHAGKAVEESPLLEGKTYEQWTVAALSTYANEVNIDLSGKTSKSDIWSAIIEATPISTNANQEGGE